MTELTPQQCRELTVVSQATEEGHPRGTGPRFSIRRRLQRMGLIELRKVQINRPDLYFSGERWFLTDAGRAALPLGD